MNQVYTSFINRENKRAIILASVTMLAAYTAFAFMAAPPRSGIFAASRYQEEMTVPMGCHYVLPADQKLVLQKNVKYMVGGCK